MNKHFLVNAKAYAALLGSIAIAVLGSGVLVEGTLANVLTVVAVVATTVSVWAASNLDEAESGGDGSE